MASKGLLTSGWVLRGHCTVLERAPEVGQSQPVALLRPFQVDAAHPLLQRAHRGGHYRCTEARKWRPGSGSSQTRKYREGTCWLGANRGLAVLGGVGMAAGFTVLLGEPQPWGRAWLNRWHCEATPEGLESARVGWPDHSAVLTVWGYDLGSMPEAEHGRVRSQPRPELSGEGPARPQNLQHQEPWLVLGQYQARSTGQPPADSPGALPGELSGPGHTLAS